MYGITDSMDMSLSRLRKLVVDRKARCIATNPTNIKCYKQLYANNFGNLQEVNNFLKNGYKIYLNITKNVQKLC